MDDTASAKTEAQKVPLSEMIVILGCAQKVLANWDWNQPVDDPIGTMWRCVAKNVIDEGAYAAKTWKEYQKLVEDTLEQYCQHCLGEKRETSVAVHTFLSDNLLSSAHDAWFSMLHMKQSEKEKPPVAALNVVTTEAKIAALDAKWHEVMEVFKSEMNQLKKTAIACIISETPTQPSQDSEQAPCDSEDIAN